MDPTEAQQFLDQYFATYPKVRKYIDETIGKAVEEGFVETLLVAGASSLNYRETFHLTRGRHLNDRRSTPRFKGLQLTLRNWRC